MRVTTGSRKGGQLVKNTLSHVRPTTDKVKQALFTKLQFFIEGKRVLDLFSGTGALGIEALSLGAQEVVFIDKNFKSVQMTKQNLIKLNLNANVIKIDALKFLEKQNDPFDLILVDPPYSSGLYLPVLDLIFKRKLLTEGGVIVCEHEKWQAIKYDGFEILDEKRYGNIILTYFINKTG